MTVASEYTANINKEVRQELQPLEAHLKQGDDEIARQRMIHIAKSLAEILGTIGGWIFLGVGGIALGATMGHSTLALLPSLGGVLSGSSLLAVSVVILLPRSIVPRHKALSENTEKWETERKELVQKIEKLKLSLEANNIIELTNLREKDVAQIA